MKRQCCGLSSRKTGCACRNISGSVPGSSTKCWQLNQSGGRVSFKPRIGGKAATNTFFLSLDSKVWAITNDSSKREYYIIRRHWYWKWYKALLREIRQANSRRWGKYAEYLGKKVPNRRRNIPEYNLHILTVEGLFPGRGWWNIPFHQCLADCDFSSEVAETIGSSAQLHEQYGLLSISPKSAPLRAQPTADALVKKS